MKKKLRSLLAYFLPLRRSVVWVLLILPLLSMLFITASEESPLYTSLSRLAWVNGHWLFMLVWSLLVLFVMVCLTLKVIHQSGLAPKRVKALSAVAIVNVSLSFVSGVFIPAKSSADALSIWEFLHDRFTALGWLSFGIVLTIFSFNLRKVDRMQSFISVCFMAFTWMSGVFAIVVVISPETYVGSSAITQIYIITMLNIFLLINDIYQTVRGKAQHNLP